MHDNGTWAGAPAWMPTPDMIAEAEHACRNLRAALLMRARENDSLLHMVCEHLPAFARLGAFSALLADKIRTKADLVAEVRKQAAQILAAADKIENH